MNYHNIEYPDMMNGSGLRVILWVSGCTHHCQNCQNPQTWDACSGIEFDESARSELFAELEHDYIKGLTLSGGDPLHENNLETVLGLVKEVKSRFGCFNETTVSSPKKDIWIYTGYTWEEILDGKAVNNHESFMRREIIRRCDVMVDGKYVDKLRDAPAHWKGSTNQRVIDIQKTLRQGEIILWED
jgi:anaerobic ribonucleoside-triphosphate reductase activating protein